MVGGKKEVDCQEIEEEGEDGWEDDCLDRGFYLAIKQLEGGGYCAYLPKT